MYEVGNYKGFKISLDPRSHKFLVDTDQFDNKYFASYDEATKEVDAAAKVQRRAKVAELALSVMWSDGRVTSIKGINPRTSSLVFTTPELTKEAASGTTKVYPCNDQLRAMLVEATDLRKRLKEIERQLRDVAINTQRGFGIQTNEDNFNLVVEKLKVEHANAVVKASENFAKPALESQEG